MLGQRREKQEPTPVFSASREDSDSLQTGRQASAWPEAKGATCHRKLRAFSELQKNKLRSLPEAGVGRSSGFDESDLSTSVNKSGVHSSLVTKPVGESSGLDVGESECLPELGLSRSAGLFQGLNLSEGGPLGLEMGRLKGPSRPRASKFCGVQGLEVGKVRRFPRLEVREEAREEIRRSREEAEAAGPLLCDGQMISEGQTVFPALFFEEICLSKKRARSPVKYGAWRDKSALQCGSSLVRRLFWLIGLALLTLNLACGPTGASDPPPDKDPSTGQPDDDGGSGGDDEGDDGEDGDDEDDGGDGQPSRPEPVITSVSPPYGPAAGGSLIVLQGAGFVQGFALRGGRETSDQTEILFASNPSLGVNVIDDDTIEVQVPVGSPGAVDITLKNPNGEFVCEECFTYMVPIEASGYSPRQGSTIGGELLTISGSNLGGVAQLLVGGAAAADLVVTPDGKSLSARTPPGKAGASDLVLIAPNSAYSLPGAFTYVEPLSLKKLLPPVVSSMGGNTLQIEGSGFGPDTQVWIDGIQQPVEVLSDTLLQLIAPANSPGKADVELVRGNQSVLLEDGLIYVDSNSRSLKLLAVTPHSGPEEGGSCASKSACLRLFGSALGHEGLAVRIGGANASVHRVVSETEVEVDLPAGSLGLADIEVRNIRGDSTLQQAFAYVEPLEVHDISPSSLKANSSQGTVATLSGRGFADDCELWVGPDQAEVLSVDPSGQNMQVELPSAPEGLRDVLLSCGVSESHPERLLARELRLEKALTYVGQLKLYQVEAPTGSIAGNTRVSLFGAGFQENMVVKFGTNEAVELEVLSSHRATLRTPPGSVGFVDVVASLPEGESAVLSGGYGYLDPTNSFGGASGGPMRGTLNVTVLNGTYGMRGPVAEATVSINGGQLVGITDARGQVTFSDGMLLKPVTITATKDMFSTTTIARLDARNVSLFIELNEGDGDPPSINPSEPQPPAQLQGRVCGFKTPPRFELSETQRLEARVRMAPRYVYSAPPFASLPNAAVVEEDCGEFAFLTGRYGSLAFYAEFGVYDEEDKSFAPWLMGLAREVESSPGKITEGIDILLDMHLDMTVPLRVEAPDPPPGLGVLHRVYSYLEIGGGGVVPLPMAESQESTFSLNRHPRVSGDGVVFLARSAAYDSESDSVISPYSNFYRRQLGDLSKGVTLGPMLEFARVTAPSSGDVFDGTVSWELLGGETAHVQHIVVREPVMFTSRMIWEVILPGGERTVTLPPEILARLDSGSRLYLTLTTSKTPRFDFNRFSYDQLGLSSWTAYTQTSTSFQIP